MRYKKGKTEKDLVEFIQSQPPGRDDYAWLFGNLDQLNDGDPEQNGDFELKYWAFTKNDNPRHSPRKQTSSTEYTFVIKGGVEGNIDGETIALETGEYVVIPPGVKNNLVEKVIENTVGITIKAPSIKGDTKRCTV